MRSMTIKNMNVLIVGFICKFHDGNFDNNIDTKLDSTVLRIISNRPSLGVLDSESLDAKTKANT